ncbi:MAG: cytochrome c biogenesis protein CcsA [Chitinophagaceae bacterium]|nr:cytochrome c biogenesis protein CcsA [Chitinophagaceae bacterium]HQV59450.1 cytochrome c biogenesis protein CcsA [Chitinophagaceae bacterium]HQV85185.1 cytochrome c biogenesis protein CcsA [Chitinophagaceae bacterium]HQX71299.1 cytochrome c biogenesis protein CcsA [Chitinophagaceae bacterium]HQZ75154.1 cytochrome c biogenesis protein CcsA [Chitinophagaceae bacterium]
MDYIGEHLLPGQLGHFFIVLSLVASLVATITYFLAAQSKTEADAISWKKLARYAFILEVISVFAIFGILFYIIHNHLFEYHYAWKHSSRSLEFKYLLACFWEGQEGSFLLWSACHSVLGVILIKRSRNWEAPVMTIVSFAQFALATMVAGLYFFGWKMGSNPFILLRDSGVLDNATGLHINFDVNQPLRPDYMLSVKDGNDLNPLLQNYWMVIHPPVLFMGFASTIVPFAFAMAGLWKKQYGEWTKPALPWALFSAAVLGVGIMMGGMWAYESLTFGGYWAWDPVENASLVPWMILVSGIHTLLIYRHSGHSLRATYLFFILAFGFILYSTFLTRSGILGESSVHAFTDLGMNFQLLTFLLIFVLPSLAFFFARYNKIPSVQKEENTSSREFWMFIGALVFFLSAIVIIGKTSLPVFNKIFGTNIAPPEDAEFAYNSIQIYVAIIMAALTAVSQYLKYKDTSGKYFWKKILIPTIITLILSALFIVFGDIDYNKKGPVFQGSIWLAVVCSIYTIVANAGYIWLGLKGNLKLSGGSISHVGFGMVLLGILISSSNKEILSNNIGGIPAPLAEGEDPRENLTLVKDMTANMGRYSLTYEGDSAHPKKQQWYYKVRFKSNDGKEEFVLLPNAFVNYKGNEGLMANPSAKHYWDHDVFTYITSIPNPENEKDTSSFKPFTRKTGDSLFYSRGFIIIQDVKQKDSIPEELFGADGTLYEVPLKIYSKTGSTYSVTSRLANAKGEWFAIPDTITSESLVLQLQKVNPDKTIEMGVKESSAVLKYVTLKAYRFPFIKLLWYGVWITAIGILISMVRRIQLNRKNSISS